MWYRIRVSKRVLSDTMRYNMECIVTVFAVNKRDATLKVRDEFPFGYIEVLHG